MKKILSISLLAVILSACSNTGTPTPQKLSQNVQTLPPATVISVIAEDNYKTPEGSQIIEKTGSFKAKDNIYDSQGQQLLVPRNAIIVGTYTNDGVTCKVTWKSIYANEDEYEDQKGSFTLGYQSKPSFCNPVRGIKKNDRLTIKVNDTTLN